MNEKQLAHPKVLLFFETLTAIGVVVALLKFIATVINMFYNKMTGHHIAFVMNLRDNNWMNYLTLLMLIIGILGTRYFKRQFIK